MKEYALRQRKKEIQEYLEVLNAELNKKLSKMAKAPVS